MVTVKCVDMQRHMYINIYVCMSERSSSGPQYVYVIWSRLPPFMSTSGLESALKTIKRKIRKEANVRNRSPIRVPVIIYQTMIYVCVHGYPSSV